MSNIKIVCERCGSASVTRDASTRWNDQAQAWEVSGIFDDGNCDICGDDTRLEEIPLNDWPARVIDDEELEGFTIGAVETPAGEFRATVTDEDGVVLWDVEVDQFGSALGSLEDAKDEARRAAMRTPWE